MHGFYGRGKRCLEELKPRVGIQRYRCKSCGKTWLDKPAWLAPGKWYGRDVIRLSLDLSVDCTISEGPYPSRVGCQERAGGGGGLDGPGQGVRRRVVATWMDALAI